MVNYLKKSYDDVLPTWQNTKYQNNLRIIIFTNSFNFYKPAKFLESVTV